MGLQFKSGVVSASVLQTEDEAAVSDPSIFQRNARDGRYCASAARHVFVASDQTLSADRVGCIYNLQ